MMYQGRLIWLSFLALMVFSIMPASNLVARSSTFSVAKVLEDPRSLWSFDGAEGIMAFSLWKCCSLSFNPHQVVIGKSGYLFIGNRYNEVINQIIGDKVPDPTETANWVANLKRIQEHLTKRGAAFLFVLAPNKHTVYAEFLPSRLTPVRPSVADHILEAIQQAGIPLYDAREEMLQLKDTKQAYRKTDTHWTSLGAATAYSSTMHALKSQISNIRPLEYTATEIRRAAGDQARMLKVSDLLGAEHDADYQVSFDGIVRCMGVTPYVGPVTDICSGPQLTSFIGDQITTTVAPKASNQQVALLICDSFCTAHLELYQNTFKTVHRVHWRHLQGQDLAQQLDRLSPDLVIFQLVERDLMQPDLPIQ